MLFNLEQNIQSYGIHSYSRGEITITVPSALDGELTTCAPPGRVYTLGQGTGAPEGTLTPEGIENADNIEQLHLPIRRETLYQSLILMPAQLIRNWAPQSFEDLSKDHFEILADYDLELILFGSGSTLRWPDPVLLSPIIDKGLGLEVMDTGAACRTYNILMTDQRRFAAALLMI